MSTTGCILITLSLENPQLFELFQLKIQTHLVQISTPSFLDNSFFRLNLSSFFNIRTLLKYCLFRQSISCEKVVPLSWLP